MSERLHVLLFGSVCALGAALALTLLVHEARSKDPVRAHVVSSTRQGLTTLALVEVRSDLGASRCVRVRTLAQDRSGRDLGSSSTRSLVLKPHGTVRLAQSLDLTRKQYDEELATVRAVVHACDVERAEQK